MDDRGAGHALKTHWLWSYKPTTVYKQQTADEWLNDYHKTANVIKTVEKFWTVYYNLPTLAALDFGNIYALFREGITASWEDAANENGISVIFYMNKHAPNDFIVDFYQTSLLLLIGEQNEQLSSVLNGCTFEKKTGGNKVAFWTSGLGAYKSELELSQDILDALSAANQEFSFSRDDTRTDWKDDKQKIMKKIVVKCISHKQRASEPVVPKKHHGGSGRGRGRGKPRFTHHRR